MSNHEVKNEENREEKDEVNALTFQKMDECTPRMKTLLTNYMENENAATRLCELLQETESLIAGGSVLYAYETINDNKDSYLNDIDIYVPVKHAKVFFDKFLRSDDAITKSFKIGKIKAYKSTLYCESFLKKNGIKKVYNVRFNRVEGDYYKQNFDIMIVRNRRTPLQVVNNFDLSFCQIWFNGQDVFASHPQDVINKSGTLQGEYVDIFIKGNLFLKNRLRKYTDKEYNIVLDTTYINNVNMTQLLRIYNKCIRFDKNIFITNWSSRVLLSWFLGIRDNIQLHENILPSSIIHKNILIVPLVSSRFRYRLKQIDFFNKFITHNSNDYDVEDKDDGYDSEDYQENESLYDLSYSYYLKTKTEQNLIDNFNIDNPTEEVKTLLFHRGANKLLEIAMWSNEYTTASHIRQKTLGNILDEINQNINSYNHDDKVEIFGMYYKELKARCTRKGTSSISFDENVDLYDLHEHPLNAGVSAEDLEGYIDEEGKYVPGYLSSYITSPDKTNIPCYYKPNSGIPNSSENCRHKITMSEVKYIVSKEFYEKYSAPVPTKLGLDQFMSHYDLTLSNTKQSTDAWGELYQRTICPYCLQFESRDSGCAYMTHAKLGDNGIAPYCNPKLVNNDLIQQYAAVSENGEFAHLEFCVECGRPCVDHQHISSTEPYTKIPSNNYSNCTGGGRAELFARILAIRAVYRDSNIKDPYEERKIASLAANDAPNDPQLMEEGQKILDMVVESRKWTNNDVPPSKEYNNNAYRGGRKYKLRRTIRKNEQAKHTKKHK